MKTPSQFQKRMFTGFNNGDLGKDLEKILTDYQDSNFTSPTVNRMYDRKTLTAHLYINGTGYTYASAMDRDFDLAFLNVILKEFRLKNK